MLITYKLHIKPNKEQENIMFNTLNCSRHLYNHLLNKKIFLYNNYKYSINKTELENYSRFLTTTDEFKDLKTIHSHLVQDVSARLINAYDRFFSGEAGFPKFKSRDKYTSFTFKQPKNMNLFSDDGYINISKIGKLKLINHRKLNLKKLNKSPDLRTLNIKYENYKWFINLTVEIEDVIPKSIEDKDFKAIGIDLGIKHYLALSNGIFVENPKHLIKSEVKLKKLQKQFSRKTKGSNNHAKFKKKLNKLHYKVKNQRKDFLHKVALKLVQTYDLIVLEDLRINNMLKNHKLAKHIQDASWSNFKTILRYKTIKHGKHYEEVDAKYTSQTCICGASVPKTLKDRVHNCPICGIVEDRDTHSAKIILSRSKIVSSK